MSADRELPTAPLASRYTERAAAPWITRSAYGLGVRPMGEDQAGLMPSPSFHLGDGNSAERRAELRAELDACYTRLYGLTRDELCYILDSADVIGADYPSGTFRVLKEKEASLAADIERNGWCWRRGTGWSSRGTLLPSLPYDYRTAS